ncbi:DNA primase family protein [Alicyclobacillus macrosporangiidus]|uniref:DNA primase family protein n=1 Tax=Alicyclobacillus macrosporangiidus TaxID=392015 RepID=UPI00049663C8|nr:DNA primase family protein [Alicyclobacillus macrosporangiidus]
MPRGCKLCESELRAEAEARFAANESVRDIANWLAGIGEPVSRSAVHRHMTQHILSSATPGETADLDLETMRTFLAAWFSNVEVGHIEVRPIPNRREDTAAAKEAVAHRRSFPVTDIDELVSYVAQGYRSPVLRNRAGWYYGVCPRKTELRRVVDADVRARWIGGGNEDVAIYPGAWADIDDHGDHDAFRLEQASEALGMLADMGYPPTFVVCSGGGRGRHVYYRFTEPVDAVTGRRVVKKLALVLQSDASIADPARVLRIPGTLHTKSGVAVPVSIEQSRPEAEYLADQFESALDSMIARMGRTSRELDRDDPEEDRGVVSEAWEPVPLEDVERILPWICVRFQRYIDEPNSVSEPVWHHMAATLKSLNPDSTLFHRWSEGYDLGPGRQYNRREAERKWRQNTGAPIKCATFERDDPTGECRGCPYFAKKTSPAMLVRQLYGRELGLRRPFGAPERSERQQPEASVSAADEQPGDAVKHAPRAVQLDFRRRGFRTDVATAWAFVNRDLFISVNPETGKERFLEYVFVNRLSQDFGVHFMYDTIFGFNGKYYTPVEDKVGEFVYRALNVVNPEWARIVMVNKIIEGLRTHAKGDSNTREEDVYEEWDSTPHIVFQNGVLDLTELPRLRLADHDPKFKCTWMVNCDWNPSARSADVDEYLLTTLPNDVTRQALLEYLGYSLCRFDTSQQRYAFLYGGGRNGKGVMIRVLSKLFSGAYATVSLQDLSKNRFSAYRLIGAAVNLVGDMSGERLEDTELIKKLTGNDVLTGERKFKDAFNFRPRVKLWYALNELPGTPDPSYGFFRRPLVFPYSQRFEERYDPSWEARLMTPEALSYWAWLGIQAYVAMQMRDGRLCESEEMREALAEYRRANDIIQMAIEDEIIEFGEEYQVPRELLHLAFETYAKDLGRKSPGAAKLMERLRNASPVPIVGQRVRVGGERVNVWRGVRLGPGGRQLRIKRETVDPETRRIVYATLPVTEAYEQIRGGRKGGASA